MQNPPNNGWRKFHKIHPACELFPLMSQGDLAGLARDIEAAQGLKIPVQLRTVDGKQFLIDGRNRLDAMEALGWKTVDEKGNWTDNVLVEHKIATLNEVLDDVTSLNLQRRNLTASQKAYAAEGFATMRNGGDRRSQNFSSRNPTTETSKTLNAKAITLEAAAKSFGIPATSVKEMRIVKREAPHLARQIKEGKLTTGAAYNRLREKRSAEQKQLVVTVAPQWSHEVSPKYVDDDGNALSNETIKKLGLCTRERFLPKDLEKAYNSVSRPHYGLLQFILQLAREIGRARVIAIAKRAERERLKQAEIAIRMSNNLSPSDVDLEVHVWGKNGDLPNE
jgi:hypothetical protein